MDSYLHCYSPNVRTYITLHTCITVCCIHTQRAHKHKNTYHTYILYIHTLHTYLLTYARTQITNINSDIRAYAHTFITDIMYRTYTQREHTLMRNIHTYYTYINTCTYIPYIHNIHTYHIHIHQIRTQYTDISFMRNIHT